MSHSFSIPFISNSLSSYKATEHWPEMKVFIMSLMQSGLDPDFIYIQAPQRSRLATLGNRTDKSIGGSIQMIRQYRKNDFGLLHLHLSSFADVSFSSVIVQAVKKPGFNIYISGLSEIERKKLVSRIDFTFATPPPELSVDERDIILNNFFKSHYLELFQQTVMSLPIFDDKIKTEIATEAKAISKDKELPQKASRILNVLLIAESWLRYESAFQHIFTHLWQKDDLEACQYAKMMLGLLLPETLGSLSKQIATIATPEMRETLAKINNRNDLVNYLAILPNINTIESYANTVRELVIKTIFIDRLKKDSAIFKSSHFIPTDSDASIKLKTNILTFVEAFQKKQETIELRPINDQIDDELKKVYTGELVTWMMMSHNASIIPAAYNRVEYRELLQNFLELDAFAIDRLVINPIVQTNSSNHYISSKVNQQIRLTYAEAEKLISSILAFVNPLSSLFGDIRNQIEKHFASKQSELNEKEYNDFVSKRISFLPRYDYLLHSADARPVEKAIYLDAKRALGMKINSYDFQGYFDKPIIGYTILELNPLPNINQLTFPAKWVFDIYTQFIHNAVATIVTNATKARFEFVASGKVTNYDYIMNKINESGIFIGYHQVPAIIKKQKSWNDESLRTFGYIRDAKIPGELENDLLKLEYWGIKDAKGTEAGAQPLKEAGPAGSARASTADSQKQFKSSGFSPVIVNNSLYSFVGQSFQQWKSFLNVTQSQFGNKKEVEWIANFVKNLGENGAHNLFANDAPLSFPQSSSIQALEFLILNYFAEKFKNLRPMPKSFIVLNEPRNEFIGYFFRELSVEIDGNFVPITFFTCPAERCLDDEANWNWRAFLENVNASKPIILQELRDLYRLIEYRQQQYQRLVQGASLLILMEIAKKHVLPQDSSIIKVEDFKKIEDQFKLGIFNSQVDETAGVLIRPIVGKNVIALKDAYDNFYSYAKAEADSYEIRQILEELNHQLSLIPYIKYAPKLLKEFRFNVTQMEQMMQTKISAMDEQTIQNISAISAQTWEFYSELVNQEATYTYKYRYLSVAFNKMHSRGDRNFERTFIDFLRSVAEEKAGRTASRDFLLARMLEALKFKNFISEKSIFYIYAVSSRLEEVKYILEGIREMKGIEADILIDDRWLKNYRSEFFAYTYPQFILNLRSDKYR